ncbi:hypothetical protein NKDENANG_00485 [Candidatus Entotheonellaceae bacterium PAL068K]
MQPVSCVGPTGHLGYAPMEPESFYQSLAEHPGAVIADSESCDIGPYPLGSKTAASPEEWQRFDIEPMLRGARQSQIPLIISSCNDTGTNEGVETYVRIIKEIAADVIVAARASDCCPFAGFAL